MKKNVVINTCSDYLDIDNCKYLNVNSPIIGVHVKKLFVKNYDSFSKEDIIKLECIKGSIKELEEVIFI